MRIKYCLPVVFMVLYQLGFCLKNKPTDIIPQPYKITLKNGYFHLNALTRINIRDEEFRPEAEIFSQYFKKFYGFELQIIKENQDLINCINLHFTDSGKTGFYNLNIQKQMICVYGNPAGIFYAFQTLKLLLPLPGDKSLRIKNMQIADFPQFSWRGMHLDVCRHFFPKEFIKEYIDILALYKMNTFHWHLTDDQGWRIEIKKYPELTSTGAYRKGTKPGHSSESISNYDTTTYGGFYTQDDIREIVEYARQRHITIVPEIEMPGHALAALASYPVYSCTGGPFSVGTKWGVFEDVFCPKDTTFMFLEDILTEVMELFPGQYIHIGGDEVPKVRWRDCPHCQGLIKARGLKDENELQSYFIQHIDSFLATHGRITIGWDEILEGGLASNAAVMSWRGAQGGIAAAKQHHKVVMTPGGYCYFDHYQGDPRNEPLAVGGYTTLEKVYSFNPVPYELDSSEKDFILGAQGNVWSEYILNGKQVEYMVIPRICALSEVLWSPVETRNYNAFRKRLVKHFKLLDVYGLNYSRALFEIRKNILPNPSGTGVLLSLNQEFKTGSIRFTMNGTEPGPKSEKYKRPLKIRSDCTVRAAGFDRKGNKNGKTEQDFHINLATGKIILLEEMPSESYNNGGAKALVDGVYGRIPWNGKEWLGFSGKELTAVIDLGKKTAISKVTVDVLRAEASWIYLPVKIEVWISVDGINFEKTASADSTEILKSPRTVEFKFSPTDSRYVKIMAVNLGIIPKGKPGEGYPAWLFVDEIGVN